MGAAALVRFEWERLLTTNEWINLLRGLPANSPLFAHDLCPGRCRRKDGSRLAPATLKHIGLTLATFAKPNGTDAFPGIQRLVLGSSRHRSTVIAALGHLETVGLICAAFKGSSPNIPRTFATSYCLTCPPPEISLATATGDERKAYEWFTRQHP
jgi:hypothetical protein